MDAIAGDQSQKPGPFDNPDSRRTLALEVENRKFWVNRDVLASYSPFFDKMFFAADFVEANATDIKLPEQSATEIEELLCCLIPDPKSGEMKSIDFSNVGVILKLSDAYQISDLRKRADMALTMMANEWGKKDKRFLEILQIGSQYKMKGALKFIVKRCGSEFSKSELEATYDSLRAEVIAGLMKYASVTPSESKCRYEFNRAHSRFQRRSCVACNVNQYYWLECVYCFKEYCTKCLAEKIPLSECSGPPGNVACADNFVRDLLNRM